MQPAPSVAATPASSRAARLLRTAEDVRNTQTDGRDPAVVVQGGQAGATAAAGDLIEPAVNGRNPQAGGLDPAVVGQGGQAGAAAAALDLNDDLEEEPAGEEDGAPEEPAEPPASFLCLCDS
ncbi:hypothetical protein CYMTET_21980 [Cymbomonas tetramitiformis]|uniref:Uncharacterized protein n=1 Tax=Cymbomonas tetramitiformis TaxID=36881 RepID=A0AAE0L2N4_9CHLO|nr:hypothetical protein CYMTET_21980 [Cymbomonas tetramitiformis]